MKIKEYGMPLNTALANCPDGAHFSGHYTRRIGATSPAPPATNCMATMVGTIFDQTAEKLTLRMFFNISYRGIQ